MTTPISLAEAINNALTNNATPEEVEACQGVENCQAISRAELDTILPLLTRPRSDVDRQAVEILMNKIGSRTVKCTASAIQRFFSSFEAIGQQLILRERSDELDAIDPVTACRNRARASIGIYRGALFYSTQETVTLRSGRVFETCPYPVRKEDTVATVARRFRGEGVTAADIREVNNLTGNEIPAGRRFLSIPLSPATTE